MKWNPRALQLKEGKDYLNRTSICRGLTVHIPNLPSLSAYRHVLLQIEAIAGTISASDSAPSPP